jgi:hypothetical protein
MTHNPREDIAVSKTASPPLSISRSRGGLPTGGCAEDNTSPSPTEMVDSPKRAVAYIRESTEEQGQGFSPDAQRESIRRFAPENNLELIGEYWLDSIGPRNGLCLEGS